MRAAPHGAAVRPRAAGFTLMELMVVIVLLSLVLAVTIPRLDLGGRVGAMEKAVRIFSAQLSARKRDAVVRQKAMYIVLDMDTQKVSADSDAPEKDNAKSGEKKSTGTPMPEGVTITEVETADKGAERSGSVRIRVSREGYVEQAAIHLTEKDRRITLFFEPFLGEIRQVEGSASLEKQGTS